MLNSHRGGLPEPPSPGVHQGQRRPLTATGRAPHPTPGAWLTSPGPCEGDGEEALQKGPLDSSETRTRRVIWPAAHLLLLRPIIKSLGGGETRPPHWALLGGVTSLHPRFGGLSLALEHEALQGPFWGERGEGRKFEHKMGCNHLSPDKAALGL